MFCNNCGKEIDEKSRFCPFCGKEMVSTTLSGGEINVGTFADNPMNDDASISNSSSAPASSGKRESLEARANSGDFTAIWELGDYDINNPSKKDIDEAIRWLLVGDKFGYFSCTCKASALMVMNRHVIRMIAASDQSAEAIQELEPIRQKLIAGIPLERNEETVEWAKNNLCNVEEELLINYFLISLDKGNPANKENLTKAIQYGKNCINHRGEEEMLNIHATALFDYCYAVLRMYDEYETVMVEGDLEKVYYFLSELINKDLNEGESGVAFYLLGRMNYEGIGCSMNDNLAYIYFQRATELGMDCSELLQEFKNDSFGNAHVPDGAITAQGTITTQNAVRRNPAPLIMGILSIVIPLSLAVSYGIGIVAGIVGIVLGSIALIKGGIIQKQRQGGDKLAKAGMITGAIGIPVSILAIIINIVFLILVLGNVGGISISNI